MLHPPNGNGWMGCACATPTAGHGGPPRQPASPWLFRPGDRRLMVTSRLRRSLRRRRLVEASVASRCVATAAPQSTVSMGGLKAWFNLDRILILQAIWRPLRQAISLLGDPVRAMRPWWYLRRFEPEQAVSPTPARPGSRSPSSVRSMKLCWPGYQRNEEAGRF